MIENAYVEYLIETWITAEKIAIKMGCAENNAIISVFDKIAMPYFYWTKNKKV